MACARDAPGPGCALFGFRSGLGFCPSRVFGLAASRPCLDCLEVFVCLPQNSRLPGYSLSTEAGSLLYVRWLFIMHKIGVFITPNFIIKTHFYAFKKP